MIQEKNYYPYDWQLWIETMNDSGIYIPTNINVPREDGTITECRTEDASVEELMRAICLLEEDLERLNSAKTGLLAIQRRVQHKAVNTPIQEALGLDCTDS